jgi:transcriptional regulator with XRE-family HTH domain
VPQNTFAVRLRVMRVEMGLSVDELARRCGVAGATWSAWERGAQPRNLVRVVERIVAETGVDRDWLMFGGALAVPSTRWYFDSAAA